MPRSSRPLTLADLAWLPDVFVPHGIILPPIVRTMIGSGKAVGGWWERANARGVHSPLSLVPCKGRRTKDKGLGEAVGQRTFLGFGTFQCGYWPDVADVGLWLIPDVCAAHPLAVLRIVRETLQTWEEVYHIRRWQSMVLEGWAEAQRLIELCGFVYEGTLRECEPGKDYAWYGRVRK